MNIDYIINVLNDYKQKSDEGGNTDVLFNLHGLFWAVCPDVVDIKLEDIIISYPPRPEKDSVSFDLTISDKQLKLLNQKHTKKAMEIELDIPEWLERDIDQLDLHGRRLSSAVNELFNHYSNICDANIKTDDGFYYVELMKDRLDWIDMNMDTIEYAIKI